MAKTNTNHPIQWNRPELLQGPVHAAAVLVIDDLRAAGAVATTATIRTECLARAAELNRIANGNRHVLAAAADYLTIATRALAA